MVKPAFIKYVMIIAQGAVFVYVFSGVSCGDGQRIGIHLSKTNRLYGLPLLPRGLGTIQHAYKTAAKQHIAFRRQYADTGSRPNNRGAAIKGTGG